MFIWQQDFNMKATLTFLLVTSTKILFSQFVGTPYFIKSVENKSYILDSISVLPTVAYSVRKVSKTYSGFCLRVRRSSDNAQLDIGFDMNGDLDTLYMKNFVGSANGFVSIWYDQTNSGKHLNQPTFSYQPKIINTGLIIKENGKPFIAFYGIPNTYNFNHLDVTGGFINTNAQVIIVNKFSSSSGSDGFLLGASGGAFRWHSDNTNLKLFHPTWTASSILNGTLHVNGTLTSTTTASFHTSLKVISLAPQTSNSGTEWDVIGRDRVAHHTNNGGGYSEIFSFATAILSSERQLLENSAISYYGL
jgi:hypothetical protein